MTECKSPSRSSAFILGMPKQYGGYPIAALLLVLGFAVFPDSLNGQPAVSGYAGGELPLGARRRLEKLAAAMAVTRIEYRETAEDTVKGTHLGSSSFSVYVEGNRFQQRIENAVRYVSAGRTNQVQGVNEQVFDGTIFYIGVPHRPKGFKPPAFLEKYLVNDTTDTTDQAQTLRPLFSFPYLDAAGLYAPRSVAELRTFSSFESLVLHYLNESDSTQVETVSDNLRVAVRVPDRFLTAARGVDFNEARKMLKSMELPSGEVAKETAALKKMQKLEPKRTVVFILNPKLGYGVVEREEFTSTGQKILRVQPDDWQYYQNLDVWLPRRCVAHYYLDPLWTTALSPGQANKGTCELTAIEFGAQQNIQFALDYKTPGTMVSDRTSAEARKSPYHKVMYFVPADGTLLRGAATDVLRERQDGRLALWFIVINCVILGLVVNVLYIRHRRKMRKA